MPLSDRISDIFLILSLKNSPLGGVSLWWRANDCGYTDDINEAGGYTKEQIEKNPSYYNNGITTLAIPYLKIIGHPQTKLTLELDIAKKLSEYPNTSVV